MPVTYCYVIKVFPCSDDIRVFLESPIDNVVITTLRDSITIT